MRDKVLSDIELKVIELIAKISKRRHIVTKFGTSVDGGKTQLLHVQIFDICPQKILAPL